jgi:hypothetical protein
LTLFARILAALTTFKRKGAYKACGKQNLSRIWNTLELLLGPLPTNNIRRWTPNWVSPTSVVGCCSQDPDQSVLPPSDHRVASQTIHSRETCMLPIRCCMVRCQTKMRASAIYMAQIQRSNWKLIEQRNKNTILSPLNVIFIPNWFPKITPEQKAIYSEKFAFSNQNCWLN